MSRDLPPGPDATPAPAEHTRVGGLAVVRRRRPDLPDDTPTVLLVHGAMDRAASFGRVMRRLPDLDVLAVDRRGYGDSLDAGVASTLSAHVDDLECVIDWTGAGRVVVVGHSLGGTLALELGTRDDGRVRGLGAFECPMPALDGSHDRVGAGSVEIGEREGAAAAAEHFYRLMVGERTWDRLRARDREARRAEGPALMAELTDLRRTTTGVALDAVKLPVVLGVGELSRQDLRTTAETLRERLPDAWAIQISNAGHGAHLSHPDEFARYVRACVARADFADEPLAGAGPAT
ncbi:MAG: alpha/beta fold hydrolase [Microthrixaceae bacterium]